MPEITADEARTIAVEAAAIAMQRATDPAARGLSMRARRDLAAQAYNAIVQAAANDLRAEGDRLTDLAVLDGSVHVMAHALSIGDAARWLLARTHRAAEVTP